MIIFHSNDVHGHEHELKRLCLKHRMQKGALWFDSGDALRGSNTVFRWHEPVLSLMGELGCTAMAMGNREFNYQRWVMRRRARERSFPLLCANLCDLRGSLPAWQEMLTLQSPEGMLTVLGATPVQYPVGSFWEKVFGFRFIDPMKALPPLAEAASQRGEAVVLLSHLGADVDKELAPLLPAGTLILGGHTHTVLSEPLSVNGCWIVQTGAFARYLGRIDYDVRNRCLNGYALLE
ncbi:metallophosphoesterase [bacterium]|nr:metallophosphoesterase [bacterium]